MESEVIDHSPITVHLTRVTGYQTPDNHRDMFCRTTRVTTGPKSAMLRRKWSKFGDALEDTFNGPTYGSEVYFEHTHHIDDDQEWEPNGIYVTDARTRGWPESDIKRIVGSDQPLETYMKIFKGKLDIATSDLKPKDARAAPGTGLRDRINTRLQEHIDLEPEKPAVGSLTAKLNERRYGSADRDVDKCTLFVENIPDEYEEQDIKDHLVDFRYRRVTILRVGGASTGRAFIVLESEAEAQKCIEVFHGKRWGHCVIDVKLSKPKPKTDGPRGRGRGGHVHGRQPYKPRIVENPRY
jgi:hypothetical protein